MFDALALYKSENGDKDFLFMHCFKKLEGCKKWDAIRLTINGKDGVREDGPVTPAAVSSGRPIGNKKAKVGRNGVPALAAINASIEKMVSSFSIENKEAADTGAAMWKAMLDKQYVKIGLERDKVKVVKMEAQVGVMKSMNEATQLSLAKMTQESKILMEDMESMDPLARGWHEMYRERIGKEVLAAQAAAAASMTTSATSMPPPASVERVPAMEVLPATAEEDVVEVQPPMTPFL